MTTFETALEETRCSGLADAVFERLEGRLYSDAELAQRVIPDLARELKVTALCVSLLAADSSHDQSLVNLEGRAPDSDERVQ